MNINLGCLLDVFFTIDSEYTGWNFTVGFGLLRVQPIMRNKIKISNNLIFKLIFGKLKIVF